MPFTGLRLYHFRNLEEATVDISARTVFLVGENGQGKTNFLEAVYFACYAASFRTRKNEVLIRRGNHDMAVSAKIVRDDEPHSVTVKQQGRRKDIFIDQQTVTDRKELIQFMPCVVFCHDDIQFVTGAPEMQRWFMNQTLALIDAGSVDDLRLYNRILRSRNAALRSGHLDLLAAYDHQLVTAGETVMAKRHQLSETFATVLIRLFASIFGDQGTLGFEYRPSWKTGNPLQELEAKREIDVRMQTTTSGPHRDRFTFLLAGQSLTDRGSTGQQRLVSLVLRVAQVRALSENRGVSPVLLLDDVLLELDPTRRRRFVEHLPEFEQAIFTFLPDEQYMTMKEPDSVIYHVENGRLSAQD